MVKTLLKFALVLFFSLRLLGLGSCAQTARDKLSPAAPVTIECWHYYNGEQLANFDELVQTFNETIGADQGIEVVSITQGNDHELAAAVESAAAAADLPDIMAAYPGTAYDLASAGRLVDLSRYLSAEEIGSFVPQFLDEGRLTTAAGTGLYLLPIAKSSEVVALNLTAWRRFAADVPELEDPAEVFANWETISRAAETYRSWSGGKALLGFDSVANFIIAGSRQLGVSLMSTVNGKGALNLDHESLHRIWRIYYVNIVMGGFAEPTGYCTDDLAAGKLVAGIISTASGPWLPDQVMTGSLAEPAEIVMLRYPTFADGEAVSVQQGAGFAVVASDAAHEAASAVFLDWMIRPEQNINFTVASSYLPVTSQALNSQLLRDSLKTLSSGDREQKGTALCLAAFKDQMRSAVLYYPSAFSGSDDIRKYLETSLTKTAAAARQNWLDRQAANTGFEALQSQYLGDSVFEAWYSEIILESSRILDQNMD